VAAFKASPIPPACPGLEVIGLTTVRFADHGCYFSMAWSVSRSVYRVIRLPRVLNTHFHQADTGTETVTSGTWRAKPAPPRDGDRSVRLRSSGGAGAIWSTRRWTCGLPFSARRNGPADVRPVLRKKDSAQTRIASLSRVL